MLQEREPLEPMLTVDQVAELLQVHPETVRRLLRRGELQGRRLGGTKVGWRIPAAAVRAYMAGDQVDQATPPAEASANEDDQGGRG